MNGLWDVCSLGFYGIAELTKSDSGIRVRLSALPASKVE